MVTSSLSGSKKPVLTKGLHMVAGSQQTGAVNTALGKPFVVRLVDNAGKPIVGVAVTFDAGAHQASVSSFSSPSPASLADYRSAAPVIARTTASVTGHFAPCPGGNPTPTTCIAFSDQDGYATSSDFTPGDTPGTYTVVAHTVIGGQAYTIVFKVVVTDGGTTTTMPDGTTTTTIPDATTTTRQPIVHATFTVSGDLTTPLYPGVSLPLNLVITNNYSSPITVAPGGITISISSSKPGCPAVGNYGVSQGLTQGVTIPANSTRSLGDLGIPMASWPEITMFNTPENQDACKLAVLTLNYTGTATG